jgi:hypothetical protein
MAQVGLILSELQYNSIKGYNMATGACDKQQLLAIFADNNAQMITAADMRILVNCVYDNFLDVVEIIDNTDTYDSNKGLSANQGALLEDRIETQEQQIQDLDADKANKSETFTKTESDNRYYTQTQIDASVYKKTETYNRQEIDNSLHTLAQSIQALSDRIDNLVQKNNLIE